MVCVKKDLPSKRRYDLEPSSAEIVWIELTVDKTRKAYIATVYMPYPNDTVMQAFEDSISKLNLIVNPNDTVLILGDCNLPDIAWNLSSERSYAVAVNRDALSGVSESFLNTLAYGGLHQYNIHATTQIDRDRTASNNHILDVVIANDIDDVQVQVVENATSSTHNALEITLPLKINIREEKVSRQSYNFKKADWDHLFQLLSCVMWCDWSSFSSTDDAFNYFYDILYAAIQESIPTFKSGTKKFPFWFDKTLRDHIKLKERCHKSYLRTGRKKESESYILFSKLRNAKIQ